MHYINHEQERMERRSTIVYDELTRRALDQVKSQEQNNNSSKNSHKVSIHFTFNLLVG